MIDKKTIGEVFKEVIVEKLKTKMRVVNNNIESIPICFLIIFLKYLAAIINCHIFGNVINIRFIYIYIFSYFYNKYSVQHFVFPRQYPFIYDILGTDYILYYCKRQTIIQQR